MTVVGLFDLCARVRVCVCVYVCVCVCLLALLHVQRVLGFCGLFLFFLFCVIIVSKIGLLATACLLFICGIFPMVFSFFRLCVIRSISIVFSFMSCVWSVS